MANARLTDRKTTITFAAAAAVKSVPVPVAPTADGWLLAVVEDTPAASAYPAELRGTELECTVREPEATLTAARSSSFRGERRGFDVNVASASADGLSNSDADGEVDEDFDRPLSILIPSVKSISLMASSHRDPSNR